MFATRSGLIRREICRGKMHEVIGSSKWKKSNVGGHDPHLYEYTPMIFISHPRVRARIIRGKSSGEEDFADAETAACSSAHHALWRGSMSGYTRSSSRIAVNNLRLPRNMSVHDGCSYGGAANPMFTCSYFICSCRGRGFTGEKPSIGQLNHGRSRPLRVRFERCFLR